MLSGVGVQSHFSVRVGAAALTASSSVATINGGTVEVHTLNWLS